MNTALNTLVKESPTAQTVVDILASRKRFRRDSNIDALWSRILREKHGKVDREDYFKTFAAFQNEGFGNLVHGRGGKKTRFVWNLDLKQVANAVKKGETVAPEKAKLPPPINVKSKKVNKPKVLTTKKLDSQIQITISLPKGINTEQMQSVIEKLLSIG